MLSLSETLSSGVTVFFSSCKKVSLMDSICDMVLICTENPFHWMPQFERKRRRKKEQKTRLQKWSYTGGLARLQTRINENLTFV